jgi:hypothetical protein
MFSVDDCLFKYTGVGSLLLTVEELSALRPLKYLFFTVAEIL